MTSSPLTPPAGTAHPRHVVTAVIVAHDGARLLPGLVQAVRGQTYQVQRAVGVDTGSRDRSGALLAELLGSDAVFGMDPATGYGAALARALAHPAARRSPGGGSAGGGSAGGRDAAPGIEWLWLLHDDCEPAPDALEQLLRVASRTQAAVVGPKLRDLQDRRVIRDTGVSLDRAGRRLTGIEPGEIDQGQHDGNRSVLAVSSAGMLVRRDVWEALGGFDPALPLFRDDIDFCWRAHAAGYDVRVVTDAVVYHRELSARQIRKAPAVGGHSRMADRRGALYVFAVNLPFGPLLAVLGGCIAGSLFRALYFGVTKQRRRALDHLGAIAWLFGHPVKIWRGRRRRAAGRKRAYAVLRPYLPRGRTLLRLAEGAAGLLSRTSPYEGGGAHHADTDEAEEDLPLPPSDSLLRRVLTHPGVLLFAGLTLVGLIAERAAFGPVIGGSGTLAGGALVPAWGGASDLWREYLAGYHATGVGSAASAPPYLGVVAVLATIFGGKPWLAVDVLLFGCVPVAGLAAFCSSRAVTRVLAVRIWLAVSYAVLPVVSGAVAAGRLGTVVAFMLLPVIALATGRMITRPPRSARRAAWAAGLLIGVAAAFAPVLWAVALGGAVVAIAAWRWAGGTLAVDACIAAATPAAVLMPWTLHVLASPSAFLLEAGIQRPGLAAAGLRPGQLLLLSPGGPGLPPAWVTAGLLGLAFVALLAGRRPRLVYWGWGVAIAGLGAALAVSETRVTSGPERDVVSAWPGMAVAVAAAGLLLAAIPAAELCLSWLTGTRRAGLIRAAAAGCAALAVSTPLIAAAYWLEAGLRGPLTTAKPQVLPAFVAASSASQERSRTLVMRRVQGVLTYQVLRDSDPVLGEPELAEAAPAAQALSVTVASLVAADSDSAEDAGESLAAFDIGYVLLPAPVDPGLAAQLNGAADLEPLTVAPAGDLWRVAGSVARVRVFTAQGTIIPVPSGTVGAGGVVAPSTAGTLVLAEAAGGWSATLNGKPLTPLEVPFDGWAQGFALPAGGGRLVITRDDLARDVSLGLEALAIVLIIIMALPSPRSAAAPEAGFGLEADPGVEPVPPPQAAEPEPEPKPESLPEPMPRPRPVLAPVPDPEPAWQREYAPAEYAGPGYEENWLADTSPMYTGLTSAQHVPELSHSYEPEPGPAAPPSRPQTSSLPDQDGAAAARKRGGSHRAARHGKPSRGWLGKGGRPADDAADDTPVFPGREAASAAPGRAGDDVSHAAPNLFGDPGDGGAVPLGTPGTRREASAGQRPPWELGGLP